MSEYTPTTDQVRAVFIAAPGHKTHPGSRHEAFERWLASITTHASTDEMREALRAEAEKVQRAAWAEIHGQDPTRVYSVAEVKQLVYLFDNVLSSALRSGVPGDPSDARVRKLREAVAAQTGAYLSVEGAEAILETVSSEPQGEPSDAQVDEYIARAFVESDDRNHEDLCSCGAWPETCVTYGDRKPWSHDAEFVARAAVRAAGGA